MGRLRLGITGGIGSGKTSVCRVFSILGVPVFSADLMARQITDEDESVKKGINTIAGRNMFINGSLDRAALATLIFGNRDLLGKIEALIHPAVFRYFEDWTSVQTFPYVIMEAAILFESGGAERVDLTATVVAPEEERIQRVIRRNLLTREQVTERMKNQIGDEDKIKRSDYVIRNSENDMIIPAILKIHHDILKRVN